MKIDYESVCATRKRNPCATLEEIGQKYNVSRERIRQVLSKHGLSTKALVIKSACMNCNKVIYKSQKFCSRECQHEYARIPVACQQCGKIFKRYQSEITYRFRENSEHRFFCSRKCLGGWVGVRYGFRVHHNRGARGKGESKYNNTNILCDCGSVIMKFEKSVNNGDI